MKKILFVFIPITIIQFALLNNFHNRFYYKLKRCGYLDKKVPLTEMKGDSIMIALTLGQSNAANSGDKLYIPHNTGKVLNYADGKLYLAIDPLLGTDGDKGNVWGLLGDIILDSGLYKKVIIVPIAIGGSSIRDWTSGNLKERLESVLKDLSDKKIKLTHILYHQGESDVYMEKSEYKMRLAKILKAIRSYDQNADMYVSIASYNKYMMQNNGIDTTIQAAQKEFINENVSVLSGPNTDNLTHAIDRYDGQHFSEIGMMKYAQAWYKALKNEVE